MSSHSSDALFVWFRLPQEKSKIVRTRNYFFAVTSCRLVLFGSAQLELIWVECIQVFIRFAWVKIGDFHAVVSTEGQCIDPVSVPSKRSTEYTVGCSPHFDCGVLRSRVNQSNSAPLDTTDSFCVSTKNKLTITCERVPDSNGSVFRRTAKSPTFDIRVVRFPWQTSDPTSMSGQLLALLLSSFWIPNAHYTTLVGRSQM